MAIIWCLRSQRDYCEVLVAAMRKKGKRVYHTAEKPVPRRAGPALPELFLHQTHITSRLNSIFSETYKCERKKRVVTDVLGADHELDIALATDLTFTASLDSGVH